MMLPKQPALPEPTISDGRILFTTGDMRAHAATYGRACFEAGMKCKPSAPVGGQTESSAFVKELMAKMGVKS